MRDTDECLYGLHFGIEVDQKQSDIVDEIWMPVGEVQSGRLVSMSTSLPRTYVKTSELLPHEQIIPHHLEEIIQFFDKAGAVPPILIDSRSKVILDGHHRFNMARHRGLKTIECFQVDYRNDSRIRVIDMRNNCALSKDAVIKAALTRTLFPPKTSKHIIQCCLEDLAVSRP
jgi:hypothetical protein